MKVRGKKNNTKRNTLKTKHKIAKKVRQSAKNSRKEIKKAQKAGAVVKKRKDKIVIPSLWPRKEEELLLQKKISDQRDEDRKNKHKVVKEGRKKLEQQKKQKDAGGPRRPVYKLDNTLEQSDLIVMVVDARDPLPTRCLGLETMSKQRIIVVTKGDLVPKETLTKWLKYLRSKAGCPVINMSKRSNDVNRMGKGGSKVVSTGGAVVVQAGETGSAMTITQRTIRPYGFKTMCKILQSFEYKNVGVFGYPSVGKHTIQEYLKSPAMLLPKKCRITCSSIFPENELEDLCTDLVFLRKPQSAQAPLPIFKRLLERCTKKELMMKMGLADFTDVKTLLERVMADKNVSGVADASRSLLKSFNGLGYYCGFPSEDEISEQDKELGVKNFTKDELARIYEEEDKEIEVMYTDLDKTEEGRKEREGLFEISCPVDNSPVVAGVVAGVVASVAGEKTEGKAEAQKPKILVGGPEPFNLGGSAFRAVGKDAKEEEEMESDEEELEDVVMEDDEEEEEEEGEDEEEA